MIMGYLRIFMANGDTHIYSYLLIYSRELLYLMASIFDLLTSRLKLSRASHRSVDILPPPCKTQPRRLCILLNSFKLNQGVKR